MSPPAAATLYRVSEDDYVDAAAFASTRSQWRTLVVIATGVAITALLAPDLREAMLIGGAVGVALVSPLQAFLQPRRARRIYREQPSLRQPFALELSGEGIETSQAAGSFRGAWADFTQWDESEKMILLYLNRAMFISLPKMQLGEDKLDFIRERLAATGLTRGKRRK